MEPVKHTLKQLIKEQQCTGESDIDIIKRWFIINDQESEGMELVVKLSKAKYIKLDSIMKQAKLWIPSMPDFYECNKGTKNELTREQARKLTIISYRYLLDMNLDDNLLDWAKKTIPTLNTPNYLFNPMIDWLKSSYGIEFADEVG